MLTFLELSDVVDKPKVKTDLPACAHGSRVRLHFRIQRQKGGRVEVLEVSGQFRVMAAGLDAACQPPRQVLSVESVGVVPTWRAVKKAPAWKRTLPPAKSPRTTVE